MPIQNTLTYEVVTPKSESDSNYEQFEMLLEWYGRDGAFHQFLFTDWQNDTDLDTEVLNIKDVDKIQNLPNSDERGATLEVEDISLNDLKVFADIIVSKRVNRRFKDGTIERVAVNSESFRYKQSGGRYNIAFSITFHEMAVPS